MKWKNIPEFGVWTTAFPRSWLVNLKFTESYSNLEKLFALKDQVDAFNESLNQLLDQERSIVSELSRSFRRKLLKRTRDLALLEDIPDVDKKLLSQNIHELIEKREAGVKAYLELETLSRAAFDRELAEKRALLWNYAAGEKFRHALFELTPDFLSFIEPYLDEPPLSERATKTKQREQTLFSYLTRFCSKSAVCGTSGPTARATIEIGLKNIEIVQGAAKKEAFFSHRCASNLAQIWIQQPEIVFNFPIALHPTVVIQGNELHSKGWLNHPGLPASQVKKISLEVLAQLKEGSFLMQPDLSAVPEILLLLKERFLMSAIEVPLGEVRPLVYWQNLIDVHTRGANHAMAAAVNQLLTLLKQFESEDLLLRKKSLIDAEALYKKVTHDDSRKAPGGYYSDRFIFFLESFSGLHVKIPEIEFDQKMAQDISLVYELLAPEWFIFLLKTYFPIVWLSKQPNVSREDLMQAYIPGAPLSQDYKTDPAFLKWIETLKHLLVCREKIFSSISEDSERAIINLAPAPVADYREELRQVLKSHREYPLPLFTSCGIFQIDEAGRWIFDSAVMGSGLNTMIANVLSCNLDEQKNYARQALEAMLYAKPNTLSEPCVMHEQTNKFTPWIFPIHEVPYLGRTMRTEFGHRPELKTASLPGYLRLGRKSLIENQTHTPRIQFGQGVLQRETWNLDKEDLFSEALVETGDAFSLFKYMFEIQRMHGFPKEVFIESPEGVKNIFVDFENFFSIEMFYIETKSIETLKIVETLPKLSEEKAHVRQDQVLSLTTFLYSDST